MIDLKKLALISLVVVTSVSAFAGGIGTPSREHRRKEACLREQEVIFSKIVQQEEPIFVGGETVTDLMIRFDVTRDQCDELNLRAGYFFTNGESAHGLTNLGYFLFQLKAKTDFFDEQGQSILNNWSSLIDDIGQVNTSLHNTFYEKVGAGQKVSMRVKFKHFEPFFVDFRLLRN